MSTQHTQPPYRIIFAGTPEFAVPSLAALLGHDSACVVAVLTQPDRPQGRGLKRQACPVKQLAQQHDLPCYHPTRLKTPEAQQLLKSLVPDLMVVVAYGLILPQPVLDIPRWGCWNVHASLLPRYRGASPIQASLLNGDRETGITLMQMDAGLDSGNILLQQHYSVLPEDNATRLYQQLAQLGADLLCRGLETLATFGKGTPQDHTLATHCGKIGKQDAKLDWQLPAFDLECRVRAYHGWPVTFTDWRAQRLRVWQAVAIAQDTAAGSLPGTVISASSEGLDVACGTGILRLQILQLPGGKPQPWPMMRASKPFQDAVGQRMGECAVHRD